MTVAGSDSLSFSLSRRFLPRWRKETLCGILTTVTFGRTLGGGGAFDVVNVWSAPVIGAKSLEATAR